jgi:hypothetical protein
MGRGAGSGLCPVAPENITRCDLRDSVFHNRKKTSHRQKFSKYTGESLPTKIITCTRRRCIYNIANTASLDIVSTESEAEYFAR